VSLLIRDGKAVIPNGQTVLEAGDEVVAVTTLEQEGTLERLLRGELTKAR
jgi:Trk K+ transport system NAD-binding subunit